MRISVSIMAHPKREAAAMALYDELCKYPFSDVYIVWDQVNDEWNTGERAVKLGAALNSDWHLVIQDDALLTPDFYSNLEGAILKLPVKGLMSLYVGTVKPYGKRVEEAVKKATRATWLRHYMLLWGVAIVIPSDQITAMLDYLDEPKYKDTQYDTRLGMFYLANRLPIHYTMPSLVNHDDDLGSLLPDHQQPQPRVAHRLATGPVIWNDEVIDI